MIELSIDIETYSSNNLKTSGLYKYTEAPDFEIILIAWAFDNEPIQIAESINDLPDKFIKALHDKTIKKTAWNAAFEIACFEAALNITLDITQWQCTMVLATMLGLPASLDAAGRALKLDTTKDAAGKALIKYFCTPCKPTKSNNNRLRNMPSDDIDKWNSFKSYNITDIEQERLIKNKINFYNIPETEKRIWCLDQKINKAGIKIDTHLINKAIDIAAEYTQICTDEAIKLTGLDNPNSVAQIKGWLEAAIDEPITSLNKKEIPALKEKITDYKTKRVLFLREEMSKTSVKKYSAMINAVCEDQRVKNLVQYYGAARTGRWAGRLIQVQNLKRNSMPDLDYAREIVRDKTLCELDMLWDSPLDVLSQLVRTAFISDENKSLIPSDFSAIEARVTAWLANESWRIEVFKTHGKIYEASASAMFKIPIESITKGSDLRQRGKVAELALGFGGGPSALINMGALDMGIPENELPKLVKMWRNANKKIVNYWSEINDLAVKAVQTPGKTFRHRSNVAFTYSRDILWLRLPSGRHLVYRSPKLVLGKYDSLCVTYLGVDQYTKRWERLNTYGGKLTENIVQAIARDLLAEAMLRLDKQNFDIVMHVHDEVILEVDDRFTASSVIAINKIMAQQPSWAEGLPLNAESTVSKYYKKE